ncbi:DUF6468 domain-containing protein [Sphingomonas sp. LM7]|uniref:DUF6468 domain-containing protein n=1 Tax=Sphingomonas sp. LM7 TaxID=1938607 RepID=UPI000983F17C|nr:DUF6468 domain-containing protein [Sphingomonas sp. LM7]AQR73629.1 hypothetical protein BXU08_08255 [Sphingomonas sp. LM7]
MSFAILANALTMILCMAVLVQSVRMMRSLRTVKDGALTEVVTALEKATAGARSVLSEMKMTLGTDCAQHARLVDQAKGLRDELSDMIGIADAACERVVNVVGLANALRTAETAEDETAEAKAESEAELV